MDHIRGALGAFFQKACMSCPWINKKQMALRLISLTGNWVPNLTAKKSTKEETVNDLFLIDCLKRHFSLFTLTLYLNKALIHWHLLLLMELKGLCAFFVLICMDFFFSSDLNHRTEERSETASRKFRGKSNSKTITYLPHNYIFFQNFSTFCRKFYRLLPRDIFL